MKAFIIAITLFVIAAASAQCRVGETLEELNARFGEGKKDTGKIRMQGHDQWYFEKDGLGVNCVMTDNKCVMEVFHRLGPKINDRDIKELLKAEGDGHGWGFDTRTERWVRSDFLRQAYRQKGHSDMFFVEELDRNSKGKPGF